MNIFENPYVVISICFFFLAAMIVLAIHFLSKALKIFSGEEEKDFTNLSKIESNYEKLGKIKEKRCLMKISVSMESFNVLYPESMARKIFDEIKEILLEIFSEGEFGAIGLSGDCNFITLNRWSEDAARENVEKCRTMLNKCLLKHKLLNVIDVRFGAFFAFGSEVTFDEAVNRAKQACTLAKNEKLSYSEWNLNNGKSLEKKIRFENNIENEIDNDRFFLEYQPVLDAKTKELLGAEVLSRLNSESEGVVSPGNFLSAVESVGINNKFDYYIFEKNCIWISNDKEKRGKYKYTTNFSRVTLCEPDFPGKIMDIAEKYGLDYSSLAIEILEDKEISAEDRTRMIDNLSILKEKGMSIFLDDFGSGYTTFRDLQSLDLSIIKIDKSIIKNAHTETGYIILKNIINTSKEIGFKTLCEGIENKENETIAINAGCDFLQGYYYYKPMPVKEFENLLD